MTKTTVTAETIKKRRGCLGHAKECKLLSTTAEENAKTAHEGAHPAFLHQTFAF